SAVLNRADVIARRSIEPVPTAVVAADQSGGIYRSSYALAPRLHGELIVDQKIRIRGIADLHKATVIQFLLERTGDAVSDDVIFPVGIALVRRIVFVVSAVESRAAIEVIARRYWAMGDWRRTSSAPCPGHALSNGNGGIAIHYNVVIATGQAHGGQDG